jgi:hypothetical protein
VEEQEPNKSLIPQIFFSLSPDLPFSPNLSFFLFFFFTGLSASQSLPLLLPHPLSISSSPARSPTLRSLSLFLSLFFSSLPFSFTLVLTNAITEGWVGEMGYKWIKAERRGRMGVRDKIKREIETKLG